MYPHARSAVDDDEVAVGIGGREPPTKATRTHRLHDPDAGRGEIRGQFVGVVGVDPERDTNTGPRLDRGSKPSLDQVPDDNRNQRPGVASPRAVVLLARHGSADLTQTDLPYHLVPGPPLTAAGEREAEELGGFLAGRGVRGIRTSPLERARRTAEIAARIASTCLLVDDSLAEIQPGETHADVCKRAWPALLEAVSTARAQGSPTAIVAHGGVVTALLLGIGVSAARIHAHAAQFDGENPLPPAGAWEIVLGPSGLPAEAELVFTPGT
jgi:2,3-bisphosphoglycerate-dependent phosphoglycerate mutase